MTTPPPTPEDKAQPVTGGPGAELRRAREAKGIERARISLQLHLSDTTVEALERDDYEHLAGTVFARGYVRKYARLLNLDDDALVEQFNRLCPEKQEPLHVVHSSFKDPSRAHFRSSLPGLRLLPIAGALALVLLIGVAIALWMRADDTPEAEPASTTTEGTNLPDRLEPTTPPAEGPQDDKGSLPWPRDMIKRFTGTKESGSLTLPPPPDNYSAEEPPPEMATPPSQAEPPTPLQQPAEDDFTAKPTADAATAEVTPLEPLSTSSSAIVLNFKAACWVDIRDDAGNKVLVGEFQPGETQRLQGVPPFSVLIGNAPAVDLMVDGKPFDLGPHTRGRVARLKLNSGQN